MTEEKDRESGPKRFLNGWTPQQEELMASWSDHAVCYHWLHDRCENKYHKKAMYLTLPIIIISTINGGLSIGTQSLFDTEVLRKYASYAIGGISILAGLLTTIANQLRYPQKEEAHRVASVSWGKFQRLIAIELAMHPNDRSDAMDFMKICRAELDRLIEQSPAIPHDVIQAFEDKFGDITDLKKPDVCGALEHTTIFESSEERLKQLSVETALEIKRKKEAVAELIAPEVQETLRQHVMVEIESALDNKKEKILQSIEDEKRAEEEKAVELERMLEERRKKVQEEMQQWSGGGRGQRSGSTSTLEMRLKHNLTSEAPHLPPAQIKVSPPTSPKVLPAMPQPSAPPENLVINPLFDRAAILSAQRSPLRPPHPAVKDPTRPSTPKGKS